MLKNPDTKCRPFAKKNVLTVTKMYSVLTMVEGQD